MERQILQALCGNSVSGAGRERIISLLATHFWSNPEHKVVYDALRALRTTDPDARREQLPAQATRMGFPDVDWQNYLTPHPGNEADLGALIEMLKKAESD